MRVFLLSIVVLLTASSSATAQQKKTFVSPELAFSRELFATPHDSVQLPRLMQMSQLAAQSAPASNLMSLRSDYSWRKDVRRNELIKQAAYKPYNSDWLGRSPLPDAGTDATLQLMMKNTPTR